MFDRILYFTDRDCQNKEHNSYISFTWVATETIMWYIQRYISTMHGGSYKKEINAFWRVLLIPKTLIILLMATDKRTLLHVTLSTNGSEIGLYCYHWFYGKYMEPRTFK